MKFQASFDIWAVPAALYPHLQPGQWVYAGSPSNKGIFLGVKPSGTVVCAWYQNAKSHGKGQFKSYVKTLRKYAAAQ